MSIMNGIRKAMESADSGLQELIDEVVTHADELEEDASERMYAGMYGEDDSADISSADIDDDDETPANETPSEEIPDYSSIESIEKLGADKLKEILQGMGAKCGYVNEY